MIQKDTVPSQARLTSDMMLQTDTDSGWPSASHQNMQHVRKELPNCEGYEPKSKRQWESRQHTQSQTQLERLESLSDSEQEPISTDESDTMSGEMRHTNPGHQEMSGPTAGYIFDCARDEDMSFALYSPPAAFPVIGEVYDDQFFHHF